MNLTIGAYRALYEMGGESLVVKARNTTVPLERHRITLLAAPQGVSMALGPPPDTAPEVKKVELERILTLDLWGERE